MDARLNNATVEGRNGAAGLTGKSHPTDLCSIDIYHDLADTYNMNRIKLIHTVMVEDEYCHDVWLDATEMYYIEERLPSGAMVVSDLMGVRYRINPPAIREAVIYCA